MLFVRNVPAEESEAIKIFDEAEPKTENVQKQIMEILKLHTQQGV